MTFPPLALVPVTLSKQAWEIFASWRTKSKAKPAPAGALRRSFCFCPSLLMKPNSWLGWDRLGEVFHWHPCRSSPAPCQAGTGQEGSSSCSCSASSSSSTLTRLPQLPQPKGFPPICSLCQTKPVEDQAANPSPAPGASCCLTGRFQRGNSLRRSSESTGISRTGIPWQLPRQLWPPLPNLWATKAARGVLPSPSKPLPPFPRLGSSRGRAGDAGDAT